MRVLVVGASGMIGSTVMRVFSEKNDWQVFGTVRDVNIKRFFPDLIVERLITGVHVQHQDIMTRILDQIRPEVVVNCVGLTKHNPEATDPLASISVNTLLPHRLADLCKHLNARLIHVSTDCVFSGEKGEYLENDYTDARDLYGKSKALGEVMYPHTITLRTSTIGHELQTKFGLLEWFLSQTGSCKGFTRVTFSGLPTVTFATVMRDLVIPNKHLSGLYHVAAEPINKYELLKLLADIYGKTIDIVPDEKLVMDRSLNADSFKKATGYVAPNWRSLIRSMYLYK